MNLTLKDKIYGFIFGMAIGDALGLGTKFMTCQEIRHRYPNGLTKYEDIISDAFRCQWQKGEWTNNVELILRFIDTIYEEGELSANSMARTLKEWYNENPYDIIDFMKAIISQDDYLIHPEETSKRIIEKMGRVHASNESVLRCLISGLSKQYPAQKAHEITIITNPSSAGICAGVIAAKLVSNILHQHNFPHLGEVIAFAEHYDMEVARFISSVDNSDISSLELDAEDDYWHAKKHLAAILWTLYNTDNPSDSLYAVVNTGGDSDTNAASVMGIAGLRYGYQNLPKDLVETIKNKHRLESAAEKLFTLIQKQHPELA